MIGRDDIRFKLGGGRRAHLAATADFGTDAAAAGCGDFSDGDIGRFFGDRGFFHQRVARGPPGGRREGAAAAASQRQSCPL